MCVINDDDDSILLFDVSQGFSFLFFFLTDKTHSKLNSSV